jgi:hypothetical protein
MLHNLVRRSAGIAKDSAMVPLFTASASLRVSAVTVPSGAAVVFGVTVAFVLVQVALSKEEFAKTLSR